MDGIFDKILAVCLAWMVLSWKCIVCQNANLTANPERVSPGDFITLTCMYTGTGSVDAIVWFNGSNTDSFSLTPGTIVPQCDVFSTINASFDPSRLHHTCDKMRKNYTLTINPVHAIDLNVKWSCTFLDPSPNAVYSVITILPTEPTSTSAPTATTITMTTTTTTVSATNTEMRTASTEKTKSTEKTANTGMATQRINSTSSCPLPVLVITGISVSGFLSILLIIIICCCCPCCFLHHCRKEEDTDKYEADLVETNDNEDANNHIKAQSGTPNPAYVLLHAPNESSTSDKLKEVQLDDRTLKAMVQSNRLASNPTSTSNKDWEDKPVLIKNEVMELEPVTTNL